ncbi:MAG: hypothetical protein KA436_00355 [Oligoflexales bacterium]|nr:hypothetical protein [Oligoflexales bacterium]
MCQVIMDGKIQEMSLKDAANFYNAKEQANQLRLELRPLAVPDPAVKFDPVERTAELRFELLRAGYLARVDVVPPDLKSVVGIEVERAVALKGIQSVIEETAQGFESPKDADITKDWVSEDPPAFMKRLQDELGKISPEQREIVSQQDKIFKRIDDNLIGGVSRDQPSSFLPSLVRAPSPGDDAARAAELRKAKEEAGEVRRLPPLPASKAAGPNLRIHH